MPLSWTIDHGAKTIVTTATGTMSNQEVMDYLGALVGQGAVGYRAIFDCRRAVGLNIRLGELAEQSKLVGSRKPDGFDGAIAVVAASEAELEMAQYYADQLNRTRLCRVFRTIEDARAWYAELDAAAALAHGTKR
jgi:hypothetical protein